MTAELLFTPWHSDGQRVWGVRKDENGEERPVYIASLKFWDDNHFETETRDFLSRLLSAVPEMYEALLLIKAKIHERGEQNRWCDVLGAIALAQDKWEGLTNPDWDKT